jgi:tetratricopeptide (TPR) repeat protein
MDNNNINLNFRVNETLHEIPSNVEEMQKSLAYYASKCIEEENHITAGLLGNYYRMLKEYDKAEMWLDKAIELANKYDSDKSRIINLLRKATLYQWQHDFLRAYTLLNLIFCGTLFINTKPSVCLKKSDTSKLFYALKSYWK